MKAVLYTRVSTGKQAESGLGLEAQLAACRAHAERKGYEVVGTFTDEAISGKDAVERRPGLQRVIELATKQPDVVVVVYSLSRLSRRQSLTWALLDDRGEYRLQVESASEPFDTSTPMGRAMLGMLGVWSQLEADMVSERTSAALEARRARGHKLGAKSLSEVAPKTVLLVHHLAAMAGATHVSVAAKLNEHGIPTARGEGKGKWHATTVARVLRMRVPEAEGLEAWDMAQLRGAIASQEAARE
jgi:site-specific DNA recombinase